MLAALALVSFFQVGSAAGPLGAGRPAECGLSDNARGANLWQRAKQPELRRYCDLLAGATSKLVTPTRAGQHDPGAMKDVVALAEQADKLLPGRAAPHVLKGRALLRLGKPQDAALALKEARARDERALDDPTALLAWARANARSGKLEEASRAYRAALPRTSALATSERAAASFEAGMIVMAQGPKGVDDAVAMLRQARHDAQDALQLAAVVALGLALDRAGQREEARAVLVERVRSDAKPILTDARVVEALANAGVAGEMDALVATALDVTEPAAAREAWKRYADGAGAKGPWAEHARGLVAARKAGPR